MRLKPKRISLAPCTAPVANFGRLNSRSPVDETGVAFTYTFHDAGGRLAASLLIAEFRAGLWGAYGLQCGLGGISYK